MGNLLDVFTNFVVDPAKRNLTGLMFWGGAFLLFIGAIFGVAIDSFVYIPSGTGEALLKSGSAILGAGVFAVIMKSAQFTELFQGHIFDVFYDPNKSKSQGCLVERWQAITRSLLRDLLPTSHDDAVKYIEKKFLNSELQYHFENVTAEYEIDIVDGVAKVQCTTAAKIVISPSAKNPVLEHRIDIENGKNFKLEMLLINDKVIDGNGLYITDPSIPTTEVMKFSLAPHARIQNGSPDETVSMKRTISWEQEVAAEPYIKTDVMRYVKGYFVEVKVDGPYKAKLEPFSMRVSGAIESIRTPQGYDRWTLASAEELMLPGQGFIIFLLPRGRCQ